MSYISVTVLTKLTLADKTPDTIDQSTFRIGDTFAQDDAMCS